MKTRDWREEGKRIIEEQHLPIAERVQNAIRRAEEASDKPIDPTLEEHDTLLGLPVIDCE